MIPIIFRAPDCAYMVQLHVLKSLLMQKKYNTPLPQNAKFEKKFVIEIIEIYKSSLNQRC